MRCITSITFITMRTPKLRKLWKLWTPVTRVVTLAVSCPGPTMSIRDMLADEDRELSLTSLVQVQRVVLDTVKVLDRGEGDEEPVGFTDEEWEKLLGEEPFEEDA
jgi:hypothetical protein